MTRQDLAALKAAAICSATIPDGYNGARTRVWISRDAGGKPIFVHDAGYFHPAPALLPDGTDGEIIEHIMRSAYFQSILVDWPHGYAIGDQTTVQVYGVDHVLTITAIGPGDELNGPEITVSCEGHKDATIYAYIFTGWTFAEKVADHLDSIIDWLDPFSEYNQQPTT